MLSGKILTGDRLEIDFDRELECGVCLGIHFDMEL